VESSDLILTDFALNRLALQDKISYLLSNIDNIRHTHYSVGTAKLRV